MTVHAHGDFIVLPHWKTRPPAAWPDIPLSHIILHWSNQSLPYSNNVKCPARKWLLSIFTSLFWLDHGSNQPIGSNSTISQINVLVYTIKSPQVCTTINRFLSWYVLRCCWDLKTATNKRYGLIGPNGQISRAIASHVVRHGFNPRPSQTKDSQN